MKCGWMRKEYCLNPKILKNYYYPLRCEDIPKFMCKKRKKKKKRGVQVAIKVMNLDLFEFSTLSLF